MKKAILVLLILVMMMTVVACEGNISKSDEVIVEATPSNAPKAEEVYYEEDGLDIHIVKNGARLKDITIEGDLFIDESLGDGEYFLENIIVKGDIIINGSGSNSGHMIAVQGKRLIISSKTNPRIVCDMDTSFEGVQIASDCIVEVEGNNIKNVTVNNTKTRDAINVIMKGQFPEVTLESTANVTLNGGISLMTVLKDAKMTDINMVDDSKMYFFSSYGQSVTIHGGTIIEAWINAEYCSLPEDVEKIGSETGVAEVMLGEVTYAIAKSTSNENDENTDSEPMKILLEGYPRVSSSDMVISISLSAYEKCNVYVLVESSDVGQKGTTPENVRDGISAGAGMKMPDGAEYIVIHETASINTILEEVLVSINMSEFMPDNSGGGDGPPEDAGSSGYVFIVIEDSKGNLSEVYGLN